MASELGIGFLPGGQGDDFRAPAPGAEGATPLQQAIKFLSLRLPRFSGQGALAGPGLMGGPGGPAPDELLKLLRRLGGIGSWAGSGGGGAGPAPPPVFTPGARGPSAGGPVSGSPTPAPIWRAPRMPRARFQTSSDAPLPDGGTPFGAGGTPLDPGSLLEMLRSQGGGGGGGY
jgi:hypothetical protein